MIWIQFFFESYVFNPSKVRNQKGSPGFIHFLCTCSLWISSYFCKIYKLCHKTQSAGRVLLWAGWFFQICQN